MVYLICPVQTEVTEVCDFIAFKVSLNMIKKYLPVTFGEVCIEKNFSKLYKK